MRTTPSKMKGPERGHEDVLDGVIVRERRTPDAHACGHDASHEAVAEPSAYDWGPTA